MYHASALAVCVHHPCSDAHTSLPKPWGPFAASSHCSTFGMRFKINDSARLAVRPAILVHVSSAHGDAPWQPAALQETAPLLRPLPPCPVRKGWTPVRPVQHLGYH